VPFTAEVGKNVDELIELFATTAVLSVVEREKRYRQALNSAWESITEQGATWGEASGAPSFYQQDETGFRTFLKSVDDDIAWQCGTIRDGFQRYLEKGEIPPPAFPMRLAVLLRKAKHHKREQRFLAEWCRHFPAGNGATFQTLAARARKIGAI
jgi:hypothetical protein